VDEFAGRMATQRHVLNVVNSSVHGQEKLFGLSASAIDRWAAANRFSSSSDLVKTLKDVSFELFFMATRSQEPVSAEYELRRIKIMEAVSAVENAV
jgi:hypothetical protein